MKKLICISSFMVAVITMILTSCSKIENGKVEFLPFQETTDGQWGMISMDGKILFQEEFKNKPTVVKDRRFFVRTKNGVWEMYDATEKPKKIGTDYAHISGFQNGRALVAEIGKPVSIIDIDGKTIKTLDKIEGKIVDGVRAFHGDYACFMTSDSLWGVINQNGDCIIKPEFCSLNNYSDGKFIGVNMKYKDFVKKDKKDKVKISIIDTKGKVIFDITSNKYENIQNQFSDGLLAVCVKKDTKEIWGIINDRGETIVKPSSKIKNIGTIYGEKFTYYNGEGWGLMNIKGETLIRAKYEYLFYDQDDVLVAVIKNGETYEFKYIDEKDNQIGDETYVKATLFSMYDGEHALVKPNDKIYSIIDKKCKQLEGLPDIVNISTYEGEDYIESDFVDLNKMLTSLKLSQEGVIGVTFNTLPKDAVKMSLDLGLAHGNKEHPAGTPYWYEYCDNIELYKEAEGVRALIFISYPGKLSKQTYKTRRVIDYDFGDWYYYHNEHTPTGYVWNKYTPNTLAFVVDNSGRMHGKLRELYKLLYERFKKTGTVAKENNSAAVIELRDGHRAVVAMKKNKVSVFWGDLRSAKEIDIDQYKDATEDYDISNISYGYLNELFPDENIVATDSVYLE